MQHVNHRLDEYHDGELSPARRRQVEAHLKVCAACRAKLEELRQVSALLHEVPVPDVFSLPQLFEAQVSLRLKRREAERSRYPGAAWHAVPVLLLTGLVVLQGLLALLGGMMGLSRWAMWLGIDVGSLWPAWNALPVGDLFPLSPASLATVFGAMLMVVLYLASIAALIPYVGWVRTLWRAARNG
jgi:anti-sigma factor RsiW